VLLDLIRVRLITSGEDLFVRIYVRLSACHTQKVLNRFWRNHLDGWSAVHL